MAALLSLGGGDSDRKENARIQPGYQARERKVKSERVLVFQADDKFMPLSATTEGCAQKH